MFQRIKLKRLYFMGTGFGCHLTSYDHTPTKVFVSLASKSVGFVLNVQHDRLRLQKCLGPLVVPIL